MRRKHTRSEDLEGHCLESVSVDTVGHGDIAGEYAVAEHVLGAASETHADTSRNKPSQSKVRHDGMQWLSLSERATQQLPRADEREKKKRKKERKRETEKDRERYERETVRGERQRRQGERERERERERKRERERERERKL